MDKKKYDNDPVYRKQCIKQALEWAKNNSERFKVIQKRYYDANAKELCRKTRIWQRSEEGQAWYKKYYGSAPQIASVRKYYQTNKDKWDRYRYRWILKGLDLHDKNLRVAKLFIKRVNQLTNYKIANQDIKMKSNGQANIKIKMPGKRYIEKLREQAVWWKDNFNSYNGTKVNVLIKTRQDIKSSYKTVVEVK